MQIVATQTVAGYTHAFAVDPDGSLWAWGANNNGQLGLGTTGSAVPLNCRTETGRDGARPERTVYAITDAGVEELPVFEYALLKRRKKRSADELLWSVEPKHGADETGKGSRRRPGT